MIIIQSHLSKLYFLYALLIIFFIKDIDAQVVTNGGFEFSDTGAVTSIEGWIVDPGTVNPAPEFIIVDDVVQNGERALKVLVNAIGSNAYSIQLIADSLKVEPGELYRYSIWAKSDNTGAQIYFTVGNYSFDEYAADRASVLTTEWKEYTLEFTVNDGQTVIRAPIHFSLSQNIGKPIYIDNLRIFKVADEEETAKPIIVEAESGVVGSDFEIAIDQNDSTITYISVTTDGSEVGTFSNPGNEDRTVQYQVTFADTGVYNLFARIRVGPERFDDDSFFYGNGFGYKTPEENDDWLIVNGLQTSGFAGENDIVNDPGGLVEGIWKWVNISTNTFHDEGITFTVSNLDSLTKVFQIGGREDGLDIDKFAFGKANLYYTVGNLDNIEPGSLELPGDKWNGPPLASHQPKFVGSTYSANQAPDFEKYWNQVTPENATKWGSVEGNRDRMNWAGVDAVYNFSREHNFLFRFHVLIWGNQQPAWMENLADRPEEQLEEIREWFEAVANRYPDIEYVEVVNEPLHDPPTAGNGNYFDALGGSGDSGWDWVLNSFRMAREIFPETTKLMINEYGILSNPSAARRYLDIINLLQEEELIDGIGIQGHSFNLNGTPQTMKQVLDLLGTSGLPVQITEHDYNFENDNQQLTTYQRVFPVVYEHPAVEGVTLWGWRPGTWQTNAYLINNDGSERPALQWLREYLKDVVLSISDDYADVVPNNYELFINYPNPFNPSTNIKYNIPYISKVTLTVYDVLGRKVQTLVDEIQPAGQYTVQFTADKISSGVYFYRLEADNFVSTKKFLLVK